MSSDLQAKRGGLFEAFLAWIERVGNKLPDPITLFLLLAIIVVIASWLCAIFGVSAVHPGTGKTIEVVNLLSKSGIRMIWSKAVTNFSNFAPMALVLVAVLGTGVAEKSGFLAALMRRMLVGVPPFLVTLILVFVCINGNVAGDSAFVIMPPLAASIYLSMGRNPMVGMFTAFACVAAGFCAEVILALNDTLAYGFTEAAARLIDPDWAASPVINFYFLFVSAILLTIVGTWVSEKLIAPRYAHIDVKVYGKVDSSPLSPEEAKGVKRALIALAIGVVVIILMCLGSDPLLGDPNQGGSLTSPAAPFMSGIIVTVAVLFFIPGAVYGFASGKYHNDKEMFADIVASFRDMAPYIVLCFFCAQFTSYFGWSNLGIIIAVKGAEVLRAMHFTGLPLLIGVVFASCIVNLFIGSASAKWAILAPVFVPMLMLLNLDPAVTQIAYRIGDSITNPLSPLFYYIPLIFGFAARYDKDAGMHTGMGTVIANMIPFSMCFTVVWIIQLCVWVLLDLPLGPGGGIFLG
ncbi:MAG: AbgT family transporter [Synergistaceae bacterium]|jgi:aminobenzoyl-glutamate transport protein|nr:AbgT family transporter [Synergistaceae bacterium]